MIDTDVIPSCVRMHCVMYCFRVYNMCNCIILYQTHSCVTKNICNIYIYNHDLCSLEWTIYKIYIYGYQYILYWWRYAVEVIICLIFLSLQRLVQYKLKRCSNKECCKQCRYVMFKGTVTKWPVQILAPSLSNVNLHTVSWHFVFMYKLINKCRIVYLYIDITYFDIIF